MCGIVGYVGKKQVVPSSLMDYDVLSIAATTLRELPLPARKTACRFDVRRQTAETWKR